MLEPLEITPNIEDEALEMPRQMLLVKDIFHFSFDAAKEVQGQLGSGADLIVVLEAVADFIAESSLNKELADTVIGLIYDETEVIGFSQSARSSVIRL